MGRADVVARMSGRGDAWKNVFFFAKYILFLRSFNRSEKLQEKYIWEFTTFKFRSTYQATHSSRRLFIVLE